MTIKKDLNTDLREEVEARHGYQRLAKKLRKSGNKRGARTVMAISKDEGDHFKKLTKLKKKM